MFDCERPQSVYRLGNDPLNHASEMEPAHRAVNWNIRKDLPHLGTYVDDPGMRARAENDQSQVADMPHQHALVHEQGIGLPGDRCRWSDTDGRYGPSRTGSAAESRHYSRSGRRAAAGLQAD